ncbi:MAG: 3'-5' exonuclease [Motilibacteraceae bacterium]
MRTGTPWRELSFAVVDVETTGLDARRDELLSVGLVPVVGGRALPGRSWYRTVRPHRLPERKNVLVHGIRPAEAAAAPPPAEVMAELAPLLAGHVLVAHVTAVERAFLGPALRPHGVRLRGPGAVPVLDTERLARAVALREDRTVLPPGLPLADAAALFGLPVHRPHHALGDALTTAQVLLAVCARLERTGPVTLRALRRASRQVALTESLQARGPVSGGAA